MYEHELDHNFTLCPTAVMMRLQIHRLFTSSYLHRSVVHLGMDILSLFSLGTFVEYRFGTLWLFSVIAVSVVLVSMTYTLIAFGLYFFGVKDLIYNHTIGFSKVAFHLLVIECHQSFKPFSVYGLFDVTPKLYPWVSLVVTQLILQHVSFIGHLSGILVGYLHIFGGLDFLLPSVQNLRSWDEKSYMRYYQIYIQTSPADELYSNTCFQDAFNRFSHKVARDIVGNCKKMKKRRQKKSGKVATESSLNPKQKEKKSSISLDIIPISQVEQNIDLEAN